METLPNYNKELEYALSVKYNMFFGQYGYIGLNTFESETLDFIVKCFKANMNDYSYSFANSRINEMYELVGIDLSNI